MNTKPTEQTTKGHRGKITTAEARRRRDMAEELVRKGLPKSETKKRMAEQFGIRHRSCERYLARAREAVIAEIGRSREELRAEAYAFYLSVRNDPTASAHDRIAAQAKVDKLLGLTEPIRHAPAEFPEAEELARFRAEREIRCVALGELSVAELEILDRLGTRREALAAESNGTAVISV